MRLLCCSAHWRPLHAALTLLAVAALLATTFLRTPARLSRAALAGFDGTFQWISDRPLSNNTAFARIGSTVYVGGDFQQFGSQTNLALVDSATRQQVFDLPLLDGRVRSIVPDDSGGWFVGGAFVVRENPAFANLVHIKADRTLDTGWNPRWEPLDKLARNSTALFIGASGAVAIRDGRRLDWKPENLFAQDMIATEDVVYINGGQRVTALDARTGSTRWNLPLAFEARTMTIHSGTLYLGGYGSDGVRAIDTATHQLLPFRVIVGPTIPGGEFSYYARVDHLAVAGNTLYITGMFRNVNGQELFGQHISAAAISLPGGTLQPWAEYARTVASRGNLFYLSNGASIRAIDATTGSEVWSQQILARGVDTLGVSSSGVLFGGFGFIRQLNGPHLAALEFPGGAPTGWRPQPNGSVTRLAASDSALYAAGAFTLIGGQARAGLAAFEHPGGALRAWDPQPNGPVRDLGVGGGRLYVAGGFSQIAGQPRPGLAAFDLATGALSDWTPTGLPAGSITAITPGEGAVYVAIEGAADPNTPHDLTLTALDPVSAAATGWTSTTKVWDIRGLALHGESLYVTGQFPAKQTDTDIDMLAVFDTRSAGTHKTLIPSSRRDDGSGTGTSLVLHDQALYVGSNTRLNVFDLNTQTPIFGFNPDISLIAKGYPDCVVGVGDAGDDLLAIGCNGVLMRYPYVRTPLVQTAERVDRGANSVTIRGRVNPNDTPTSAFFQISADPKNCDTIQTIPVSGVLSGTADLTVSVTLSNLTPGGRYYFHLVASNAFGVSYGQTELFFFPWTAQQSDQEELRQAHRPHAAAPAEATATPAWRLFLPALERCPTDGALWEYP